MYSYLVWMFLISLILTLILEIGLAFVLKIRGKKLFIVLLVNILTNPLAVFLSWLLDFKLPFQLLLEVAVVAIEGCVYFVFDRFTDEYKIKWPFLTSLILNAFSYLVGKLINISL